jgi:hypothetical protein
MPLSSKGTVKVKGFEIESKPTLSPFAKCGSPYPFYWSPEIKTSNFSFTKWFKSCSIWSRNKETSSPVTDNKHSPAKRK